jgi:hypothetical protein
MIVAMETAAPEVSGVCEIPAEDCLTSRYLTALDLLTLAPAGGLGNVAGKP